MKKIILVLIGSFALFSSCEKDEEVEPDSTQTTAVATYKSKYFRTETAKLQGFESITINGVTTHIGTMTANEWMDEIIRTLPDGIELIGIRGHEIFAIEGIMTYRTTGYVWVGDY